MNMQRTNPFERIWALGYHRLCPIVPPGAPLSDRSSLARRIRANPKADARGKTPGVQWPDGSWSGFDFVNHESTEADLTHWQAMGAGVGIKTGQGLVLIDADTIHEDRAAIIKAEIEQRLGVLPVRIGRYPKAGYLVRTDPGFQYARVEFGERDGKGRLLERVEILSEGRQFVAEGIHPGTLQPYRWPTGLPPYAELPYASADALSGLLAALRPLLPQSGELIVEGAAGEYDQAALAGDPVMVERAVRALPNTTDLFPSRESYRDIGYAIKAALPRDGDLAFELFADWSSRWQDDSGDPDAVNDPDVVASDWARMKPPFRRGASWLYELAEQHSGGSFSRAELWLDPPGSDTPLFPENLPNAFGNPDGSGSGRRPLVFEGLAEAAQRATEDGAAPLVDGLLDQGAMTVLYGESNSGKTFVAMDIGHAVASGRVWGGMETARARVVYVAAEGGRGARKRAAALRARYGDCGDAGMIMLLQPVDLLHADADLRPLIAAIRDRLADWSGPVLIVIDTLSRAMAGGDENASTDMGVMVKHLDAIRNATGAHVLVVHHSGKDKARGARGHSLLRAATDTEIEIADRTISVTKQRDLDGEWSAPFSLTVATIGIDAKGRPVTSCTVDLVPKSERAAEQIAAKRADATEKERAVIAAMAALEGLSADGKPGVKVADLVGYFLNQPDKMSAETVRFHLRSLLTKCLILRNERGKWAVKAEEKASSALLLDNLSNDQTEESGGKAEGDVFS